MAAKSINGVLQHLRQLAAVQTNRGLADGVLLERFVGSSDDAAFTALVERHGPMVLGVCRRTLGNLHDAEDACQATFLVLARKAGCIRKRTSLASWLHGVACRVAATLKRDQARRARRQREVRAPAPKDAASEVSWREMQMLLDEELAQLPQRYRTPLILCYLDGKTRDEAAGRLGLSVGSLHGRLERGRNLLRLRLAQRGLTLSAALFATALGESVAHAALTPTLVVSSTKAALLFAAGRPLPESAVGTQVVTLTQGVLKSMFLTKLKLGAGAAVCAGLFALIIAGSFTSTGIAQDVKPPAQAGAAPAAATESDEAFIRRISKDLRGSDPTPAEIHFFLATKDAGKRQKLIDLFIQERQAKKEAQAKRDTYRDLLSEINLRRNDSSSNIMPFAGFDADRKLANTATFFAPQNTLQNTFGVPQDTFWLYHAAKPTLRAPTLRAHTLQSKFYKELHAVKEKGDVAKITQNYLDRLAQYVKDSPKNEDVPEAMLQIMRVYESQGKTVEANAWRDKLVKEHPKSAAAKMAK